MGKSRPVEKWTGSLLLSIIWLLLITLPAFAQEGGAGAAIEYRSFLGMDSRLLVWIVSQLHLMFAAFVLAVPIFAVIVEIIGVRTKDKRYDKLAHEFTKLLAAAFSTTAAFGALLAFLLFGLYPGFMNYLGNIFHSTFYLYALLIFGEAFSLYLYYYSWDRLQNKKGLHITLGVLLNLFGTALMFIANSWIGFMMTPKGVDMETGRFVATLWEAVSNPLWMPLNIHRLIANVAFGGFIVGAYAAVKFLSSGTEEQRRHYDWMGYVGNFIGISALLPLAFAGYWLGMEIYNASPVMGNIMMGGGFSWTFVIQAILIGFLFIGGNYYLWAGMSRIEGSERYTGYIKYLNVILVVCFAIWVAPHNLPLSSEEQILMGGQYHPTMKYLGLMSAKNAAVYLIILSTFFSFLLYMRANKGETQPFSKQGRGAKVVLSIVGLLSLVILGLYGYFIYTLDPATLDLPPDRARYFVLPAGLMALQMLGVVFSVYLTFKDRGKIAQGVLFAVTIFSVVFVLGIYGFAVMTVANPFLRNIAVIQVLIVLTCLLMNTVIDIFLFRKAEVIGEIRWGKIADRTQYVLILLCVSIVLLMGLMGFVRSGLRENWHIYGVLQDTSQWAYTPTMAYMGRVVGGIVILFLALVVFVFWLSGLGEKKG